MTTEVGEQFLVFNKGRFWVCRTSADVDFQVCGVSQDYKLRDIAALPMRHQNRTLGNSTENFIPRSQYVLQCRLLWGASNVRSSRKNLTCSEMIQSQGRMYFDGCSRKELQPGFMYVIQDIAREHYLFRLKIKSWR